MLEVNYSATVIMVQGILHIMHSNWYTDCLLLTFLVLVSGGRFHKY